MTEISIAGAIPNPSIVLPTGKAALPIKAGQANAFKAKSGEHYGNLKKKDAEEQLLDNVVAKPTGEDAKPVDAEGTRLTLESAFIQAIVEGNEAAIEAAMPGQLDRATQGYQPSAQGAAGASLSEGNNLGDQVFAYAGADALLLAQAETGITAGAGAATPVEAAAGIGPLGVLGIVGLGVGVAVAVGGRSEPATVAPYASRAGEAVIDLGIYGKLIAPVQVEGAWYYYWDRSGDGTSADIGALNGGNDFVDHNVLDGIFTSTLAQVTAGTVGTGTDTTDLIRYANLNGVKVALPTANGGVAYPQGLAQQQNGTSYSDAGPGTNGTTGTFNELLAIWDAYNGTGTGAGSAGAIGAPAGWQTIGVAGFGVAKYVSATPEIDFITGGEDHASISINGFAGAWSDQFGIHVALQVL